jgi:hypothetical protein
MPRKKLARNAPCPCGCGKKYEVCSWDKGFEWVEDEAGTVFRSTPMTPEVQEALEQIRQAFIAKHGREPGPDDLLFPDMPHPEHLEAMMVEDMRAAGLASRSTRGRSEKGSARVRHLCRWAAGRWGKPPPASHAESGDHEVIGLGRARVGGPRRRR